MGERRYEDNPELIRRSQAGDRSATEALVRNNAGLVAGIAVRFAGRGTDTEDLIGIGNLGLIKAIRTFDCERGCAFSTYAVPLIFGEIRRFLRDDGLIKVSREQKRLGAALLRERERAAEEAGGEGVRLEQLAQRVGVSPAEAASALSASSPVRSLSEVLYGEEDGPTLENCVADPDEQSRREEHLALSLALETLPPLWRRIIGLRYFKDLSQQQTARLLGLTQVKVSREEKKILALLRQKLS